MADGLIVQTFDAAWSAIEAWPALGKSFNKRFKSDAEINYLDKRKYLPAPSDIGGSAAIAILTQPFNVVPRVNKAIDFPIALKIQIWINSSSYRRAHNVIEEAVKALYASRPGQDQTKPTFLEAVVCGPPQQVVSVGVTAVNLTDGKSDFSVFVASATVIFKALLDPKS